MNSSFMSTDPKPSFLLIKNNNVRIFNYDGQNIITNLSKFKINKNNLTSKIYGIKQKWIPAPIQIMNIKLKNLQQSGGLYHNYDNNIIPIIPMDHLSTDKSPRKFTLDNYILELHMPYANIRQQEDKLMFFKGENGLIGKISGYRDKNQDFVIEWVYWTQNGKDLSYGTIN
jgi:hypothetical protein